MEGYIAGVMAARIGLEVEIREGTTGIRGSWKVSDEGDEEVELVDGDAAGMAAEAERGFDKSAISVIGLVVISA